MDTLKDLIEEFLREVKEEPTYDDLEALDILLDKIENIFNRIIGN